MIALKLVFQSLAGVGSVAAVAGGGYYVFNTVGNEFYLVSATSETSSVATTELWTTSSETTITKVTDLTNNKTQKNYKCFGEGETGKEKTDLDCEIYSIGLESAKKATDFAGLKAAKNKQKQLMTKAEITAEHFFILKASSSLFSEWSLDGKQTITLLSSGKVEADKTKKYAALTVHAKIGENKLEGKTQYAIVQATTLPTSASVTTTPQYKCSFLETKDKDCFISLISSQALTTGQTLKDLTFTSVTIPATQAALTITTTPYYLLSLKTDTFDISNIPTKTPISFSSSTTPPPTTTFAFSLEAFAFVFPKTGSITEVIISQ